MPEARQLAAVLPTQPQRAEAPSPKGSALTDQARAQAVKAGAAVEIWHTGREWCWNTPEAAKDMIRQATSALEAINRGPSRQEMAVILDKLFAFAQGLGKFPADGASAVATWAEALGDMPPDLLHAAIRRTIRSHKFNTLPTPGEIRDAVKPELTRRRRWLYLAKTVA